MKLLTFPGKNKGFNIRICIWRQEFVCGPPLRAEKAEEDQRPDSSLPELTRFMICSRLPSIATRGDKRFGINSDPRRQRAQTAASLSKMVTKVNREVCEEICQQRRRTLPNKWSRRVVWNE